jgi:hypothetical protein
MVVGACWVPQIFRHSMVIFGEWAAVAVALPPWAIILASSVSGDAITLGLGLLLVAKIFETRKRAALSRKSLLRFSHEHFSWGRRSHRIRY